MSGSVDTERVPLGQVETCGLGGGGSAVNEAVEVMTPEERFHKATPCHKTALIELGDGRCGLLVLDSDTT